MVEPLAGIRFNCPTCKQSIETPPTLAGDLIVCPSCKNSMSVPIPGQTEAKTKLLPPSKTPHDSGGKQTGASSKEQPFLPVWGWWVIGGFIVIPVMILVSCHYGIIGLLGFLGILAIIGGISFIAPPAYSPIYPLLGFGGKHTQVAARGESTPPHLRPPQDQRRACPFCREQILASAVKCKHCGEFLTAKPKKVPWCWLLLTVPLIVLFMVFIASTDTSEPSRPSTVEPSTVELSASISFDGGQFVISNNDSFDWTNVELEVNSKLFSGGYKFRTSVIRAGDVCTVGAMQFADSDGERFNPFTHKALKLTIWCNTPHGEGFGGGQWR